MKYAAAPRTARTKPPVPEEGPEGVVVGSDEPPPANGDVPAKVNVSFPPVVPGGGAVLGVITPDPPP